MSKYDIVVVVTDKDYIRVRRNFERLFEFMPFERIIFIGNEGVGELIANESWKNKAVYINENEILSFSSVQNIMEKILGGSEVKRGVIGWYYQQFLKMSYSFACKDDYYLVWDGDTIPCKRFDMFSENGFPYFDVKTEHHEEYFITLERIFPGMRKVIGKSFISEHMLFNVEIMRELIAEIEKNDNLSGSRYYEKILYAIRKEKLLSNSFSEFETYGTYVAFKHQDMYRLRDWHSLRYGAVFFKPDEMNEADFLWLSKDFDAISFEKNEEYLPDYAALFYNPEYRQKLSARTILEAIQDLALDGIKEVWNDMA